MLKIRENTVLPVINSIYYSANTGNDNTQTYQLDVNS